jgi:hypothetical protein
MVRLRRTAEPVDVRELRAIAGLAVYRERFSGRRASSDDPRMQRLIEEERAELEHRRRGG